MQKYLLSLILVFQIKHSLAVCTYKVSNLKLVKIVFSSEFVIFFREIVPLSSLTGPQGTSAPIGRQDSFTRLAMSHRRHDVLLANQAVLASQQRSHYHWSVRLRQLSSAMFASFKKLFFILQQNWGDIYLFEMWRPLAACQILAAFCWPHDTFWWLLTRQRWRRRWYDVDNKAEEEDDCKQEKAEDEVDKMTRWQDDKMTRWQDDKAAPTLVSWRATSLRLERAGTTATSLTLCGQQIIRQFVIFF